MTPHAPDTLRPLVDAGLCFAVLRDAQELAAGAAPDEIDLLVHPRQFPALCRVLAAAGFVRLPAWGHAPHHFFVQYREAENRWTKLDVVTRIAFGRPSHALATDWAERCLDRRRPLGELVALSAEDELATLLLHCLLDKGCVPAHRRSRLVELARQPLDARYLEAMLAGLVGGQPSWSELSAALAAEDWPALAALGGPLRRALRRRAPLRVAWQNLRDRALRRLHRWVRFVRPNTPAVAIVAPDGAGKSTLIATLEQTPSLAMRSVHMGLYRKGHRRSRWQRLPGLGLAGNVLAQWRRYAQARCLQARGCLVLFDRYTYDALLPTAGANVKRWRRRLLAHACPGPDMVVMLDAPGEVLFARKGEHSVEHLERQRQGYLAMRARLPRMVVVDATRDADSVCRQVASHLWRALLRRRGQVRR